MTEREWLDATDPQPMLAFLQTTASERKLRLFACAACRRIWDWLMASGQRAVEVAEKHADGLVSADELQAASRQARDQWVAELGTNHCDAAAYCLVDTTLSAHHCALGIAANVAQAVGCTASVAKAIALGYGLGGCLPAVAAQKTAAAKRAGEAACQAERIVQCALLRDVFHGPCPPVFISSRWLAWEAGTVTKLARAIYDEARWSHLPVPADALEEAGCDNQQILGHLRGPGPHVKGCWVVDALLGKW